jgi:ATP-dependent Clp protease ATP-binding subunit ClpA
MFERFTTAARQAVTLAQTDAREREHRHIGTEHLLMGLLRVKDGIAASVLADLGVSAEMVGPKVTERGGTDEPSAPDRAALAAIGVDLDEVRRRVEDAFGRGALERALTRRGRRRRRMPLVSGHIPFTRGAKKALELSLREALALRHNYIGTEHILLGILREHAGLGAALLRDAGVRHDQARAAILDRLHRATGT